MKNYSFSILLLFITLTSCDRPVAMTRYREIIVEPQDKRMSMPDDDMHRSISRSPGPAPAMGTTDPQMQAMLRQSVGDIKLSWTTPPGWTETKGEGLRMVTFKAEDNFPIECSIVSLGGMAGGKEANLERWMRQIQLDETPENLNKVLQESKSLTSKGGFKVTVYDFTVLQVNQNETPDSIIAAIVEGDGLSVFIKMTGNKSSVLNNKHKFMSLCTSLKDIHE